MIGKKNGGDLLDLIKWNKVVLIVIVDNCKCSDIHKLSDIDNYKKLVIIHDLTPSLLKKLLYFINNTGKYQLN